MCLHPIRKQSNKKYFLPGRWESYYNEYPCGECEECKRNRELDEYIRCLWESKYTFNECKGYAIFDTLSYDNKHLPHVQDVCNDLGINKKIPYYLNDSCFRLADWRSFVTNLNANIVYYLKQQLRTRHYIATGEDLQMRQMTCWRELFSKYYGFECPKQIYNYMMASEFGHDDEYIDDRGNMRKGTRRPHYHIIFFCYLPEYILDPASFSRAIDKSWKRGRTDGVDWHNKWHSSYYEWRQKRVFSDIKDNTLNVNVLNVLSYIIKYVHKDVDLKDKFGEKEEQIFECIYPYYFCDYWKLLSGDYETYKQWKRFKRNIFNFSKKGHNYGRYFVDWLNGPDGQSEREQIMENAFVVLPMNKNQKKYKHSLPAYYVNKLFKESFRDSKGKKCWRWNEDGIRWKRRSIIQSIHHIEEQYKEFVMNAHTYMSDDDLKELNSILLSIKDLDQFYRVTARWYRLFEGRIMDKDVKRLDFKYIDPKTLPSWQQMVDIIVDNVKLADNVDLKNDILSRVGKRLKIDGEEIIFNYASPSDVAHFGRSFICNKNLGSKDYGYSINREVGWQMDDDRYYGFKVKHDDDVELRDSVVFGQINVLHAWMVPGFDKSVRFKQLFDKYKQIVSDKKQELADYLDDLRSRLEKSGYFAIKNK